MTRVLTWTVISAAQAKELLACKGDGPRAQTLLAQWVCPVYTTETTKQAVADLYYHTWRFACQLNFGSEQMAALLAIVHQTLADTISTQEDNMVAVLAALRAHLILHSIRQPPFADDVFSLAQAKLIQKYMLRTYFRNFRLYKAVCAPLVRVVVLHATAPRPDDKMAQAESASSPMEGADGDVELPVGIDLASPCVQALRVGNARARTSNLGLYKNTQRFFLFGRPLPLVFPRRRHGGCSGSRTLQRYPYDMITIWKSTFIPSGSESNLVALIHTLSIRVQVQFE